MFVSSSEKSYLFMDNVKNDNEIYDKDYDEFYGKWSRVETYKKFYDKFDIIHILLFTKYGKDLGSFDVLMSFTEKYR